MVAFNEPVPTTDEAFIKLAVDCGVSLSFTPPSEVPPVNGLWVMTSDLCNVCFDAFTSPEDYHRAWVAAGMFLYLWFDKGIPPFLAKKFALGAASATPTGKAQKVSLVSSSLN